MTTSDKEGTRGDKVFKVSARILRHVRKILYILKGSLGFQNLLESIFSQSHGLRKVSNARDIQS